MTKIADWLNQEVPSSSLRYSFATCMLALSILIPVTATEKFNVFLTAEKSTWPVVWFILAMIPDLFREIRTLFQNKIILITSVCLFLESLIWLSQGYRLGEPRLLFMVAVCLFFPAASAWFRVTGEAGFQFVLAVKVLLLGYASYKIGFAIFENVPANELSAHPPIYRNVRHFNYDLALVSGLAGGLIFSRIPATRVLLTLGFSALGFFSFWSGGRGEFVAIGVMLAALAFSGRPRNEVKFAVVAVIAFLSGGLLVFVSGYTDLLLNAVDRMGRDDANAVSSGRWDVWIRTLHYAFSNFPGAVFGHGPESFVREALANGHITHPHNAIVQWVLEYGVIGSLMLVTAYASMARQTVWPALFSEFRTDRLCAATVIGMTVFSLVDGIYYHAAPLIFMTLIWAYLYSQYVNPARKVPSGS